MKELKDLYDAVIKVKTIVSNEAWEQLTPQLRLAGKMLHTTKTLKYHGLLTTQGRSVTIKVVGLGIDLDDLLRLLAEVPNGSLNHEVDMTLVVFDKNTKPMLPVVSLEEKANKKA